jgi:spermidine/putrescine transport system permease protein
MTLRPFAIRITPAAIFVLVFLVVPLGVLFAYSFGRSTFLALEFGTTLDNYRRGLESGLYRTLIWRSVGIGALVGAVSVALAYPLAFAITLGPLRRKGETVLFLVLLSLFSAYIVRVYAWRTLLGQNGAINSALRSLGLGDGLHFLIYNQFAVVLTLVNVLVPMAVLPLYSALQGVDRSVLEAAQDLGASRARTFRKVTLPMSIRGVQAAFALCFITAAGDYVTPQLVGGARAQMLGNSIASQFGVAYDWPLGSALAFVLVLAFVVVLVGVLALSRAIGLKERP